MSNVKLNKEEYDTALDEVRRCFAQEREESLGELQGKLLLDFMLEKIGPAIYNQAISDMQKFLSERIDDMYEYMR